MPPADGSTQAWNPRSAREVAGVVPGHLSFIVHRDAWRGCTGSPDTELNPGPGRAAHAAGRASERMQSVGRHQRGPVADP